MSRAVVYADEVETAYRRAGYGPVVVVLGFAVDDDTALPDELVPLIARCRVILPDHEAVEAFAAPRDADDPPFAPWLHGFLEGLGIAGVRVVAQARYGPALEQHAAAHPGDVERIVLFDDATTGTAWSAIARAVSGAAPPTDIDAS
jgi:pimeloyl-ACP methyl ester carboxylesterase